MKSKEKILKLAKEKTTKIIISHFSLKKIRKIDNKTTFFKIMGMVGFSIQKYIFSKSIFQNEGNKGFSGKQKL